MIDDTQAVTVRDGKIFWRGTYLPRRDAEALRDRFANANDWFADQAHAYADQLRKALETVQ